MKTGILIHGCNVRAENWRHLAWGTPPHEMGRVPQGLLAALECQAEVIVLGTGASRKIYQFAGSNKTGRMLLEAEYTLAYLETHMDDLLRFKAFADACVGISENDWTTRKEWLKSRITLDTRSLNTISELREAGDIFVARKCERVMVVSSPTHLIRVLRDASSLYQRDRRYEIFQDRLLAMPSMTCYEGSQVSDVVIVEPPHRPDRSVVPSHRRIARMLQLQKLDTESLNQLIREFDDLLQRYEDLADHGKPDSQSSLWPTSASRVP